ncbi:cytochrome c oxidase assembly protein [Nonomuraea sp. SYSU D8015]|uniref:cytochrome c oxidase assembly protein n=1 Tax=Nonomuraea sp. SYSU D8015 TaxID=2593644 RepID=UPI0016610B87|nr:cytochrome c oxidase assembly protein [Nonomuraea sp. SYSU D8015]
MRKRASLPVRLAWPTVQDSRIRRIYAGSALIAAGLLALVVALGSAGAGQQEITGLPTAGPLTEWGLPVVRFCSNLCAVATVGTLLAAAVLAPAASPERAACVRAARRWTLGWAVAIVLSYVLTVSDVTALPAAGLLASSDLLTYGMTIPQARILLPVLAVVAVAGLATRVPRLPLWIPLLIAVFAMLPPTTVGHAASAADHDIALSALMAHLVTVSLWVGGLGAVLVHFRRSDDLRIVLPRFSTIALCCFAGVAVSGLAAAWVRLNAVSDLWLSEYGWFLLAKTAALMILALFGQAHRRRTVARVADRSVRQVFTRLAAGEMIVMAAAMALAVGLSRTPPPVPEGGAGGGHDMRVLEYDLAPVSPATLLTEIRPDPMILLILALPAIGYLVGMRRVPSWPAGRALAWYAGLALMALVLLGGVGGYARAMASVHALQHTVLAVVAPVLLCLGAPLTLAARATTASSQYGDLGSRFPVRRLSLLAVLPAAYMLAFPLLFRTGWLEWSLAGHVPRLVTASAFFGAGLLVFWVVAGVDPLPRPISWTVRAGLLAAVLVVQLAVGAFLLRGPLVAADWFLLTAPPAAPDLVTDQRLAGAVYLLVPVLPLALLGLRLARARRAAPAGAGVRPVREGLEVRVPDLGT